MKKVLLCCAAALFFMLQAQDANAQGASCAEATPLSMIVMPDGDHVYWYSTTSANNQMFPSSTPADAVDGDIRVFEDCDGTEAIKLGTNSYYMEAGKDYFVRLQTHAGQMWMLMGIPFSDSTPEGMYCVKPAALPALLMGSDDNVHWYTYTPDKNVLFPSSVPMMGAQDDDLQVFEDCHGVEATKIAANSYYLEAGVEYKVRLQNHNTPGLMWMLSGLDVSGAPEGMYCFKPKVISTEDNPLGPFQTQAANRTVWYSVDVAWPAPLIVYGHANATDPMFSHTEGSIAKVVTKLGDCKGVTNESNELLPNQAYAKAGTNLVAVTTGSVEIANFGFSLITTASCGNHPAYSTLLTPDVENVYPNAAWTLTRRYVVEEAGNYTITNHGAEGTILRVGKLVENACDFDSNPLEAVVGEDNEAAVTGAFEVGDIIVVESDAFDVLAEGNPYLKIEKGGATGITRTQSASRRISVSENPNNGSFTVKSYLMSSGATIAVYDMAARKVYSTVAPVGADEQRLNLNVPAGQYLVVVYGKNRSESAHVIVR